ncbi:MAG TPA: class I SAM-dependent methyltransferase [Tepidisphaeraceae bacterium]|nr:class I SAM-dependent methyltransferase [Tepidisphaeraceae bacterium]
MTDSTDPSMRRPALVSAGEPTVAQTRAVWESIAAWWDRHIGEGNDFQKTLIIPATDRLLDPKPGQTILDVACGNGNYSRILGRRGVRVVACDFAENFLQAARQRTTPEDGQIEYVRVDATSMAELLKLGEGRFDAAVCSMAMMDMIVIDPLMDALRELLKPTGRFVFSLPHPCFNSNDMKFTADLVVHHDRIEQVFGVEIRQYLTHRPGLSVGIVNQPQPHHFFHRPLAAIFAACFSGGFAVDGLEEPAYPPAPSAGKNPFSWQKRPEIPPAIVIRARPRK